MFVYLVQHGQAKSEKEDPDRSLTDEGREAVDRVAALGAGWGVRPRLILHSGKTRARQTAEIFAARMRPAEGVREGEGLAPNDDPVAFWKGVEDADGLMIVGHLPFLSHLAALLVTGDPGAEPIRFTNGALIRLTTSGRVGWKVDAVVPAELAPKA